MKKLIIWLMIILVALTCLWGCEYDKDGDAGYQPQDEYVLPTTGTAEKGTVPYVVAKLIAAGQVVRDYNELVVTGIGAKEAYSIRTNGVDVEIYRFDEDSALFQKIKELGAYPLLDEQGNVLSSNPAYINGNFVMMIPTDTNDYDKDVSQLHEKLVQRFNDLQL